jgi:hypothetical protein
MADVININGVSYCGIQANEVLIKPAFLTPQMEAYFDVMLAIKSRKQLALDNTLEDIIQSSVGCGRDVTGEAITLSEKFIDVCDAKINLDQCVKGLRDSFMEEFARSGNAEFDITGTRIADYIIEKVQAGMKTDLWRLVWFGNTALAGDQVLGICDGFWKRLIASAQTYDMYSYNLPTTLTTDSALDALRDLHDNCSDLLANMPEGDKYFAVTKSVYNNYLATNEDACCGDRGIIMLNGGVSQLFFRGIEVRKEGEWDRAIAAKGLSNPNRIVYTYNKNLVVGTDAMADTNSLEIIYNPYEKTNQIDAEFKIGTQYKYDELTAIAY